MATETPSNDPYAPLRNLAYMGVHYTPYDWVLDEVAEPQSMGVEGHEKTRNIIKTINHLKPANMK
jgi:hypothetical protein